jgi:hypothetical protein
MLVYGISSERAFGILTCRSQQTDTKLSTLAEPGEGLPPAW